MDLDQLLASDDSTTMDKNTSKKGEKTENNNISSAVECTKKEGQQLKVTMINIHDKIREALAELRHNIVADILHEINN